MSMLLRRASLRLVQLSNYPPLRPSPSLRPTSLFTTAVDLAPLPPPAHSHSDCESAPPPPPPPLPSSSPSSERQASQDATNLADGASAVSIPLQDSLAQILQTQIDSLRSELAEQKALVHSILKNVDVLKSQGAAEKASGKVQWPEWIAFVEHLKSSGFLKAGEIRRGTKPGTSLAEDTDSLKRAIYKFSQVHESIYKSLPEKDIKVVAQYGRVDDDQRALASLKRLRLHYGLDEQVKEDDAAGASAIPPKLSDLTRVLFGTSTMSQDASFADAKLSFDKLLTEIINLSSSEHKLTKEEATKPSSKLESKSELWECPRCHFKNLDSKHRCVECSRRRSQRTYPVTEEKDSELETILNDEIKVKPTSSERQTKKKIQEKGDSKLISDEENRELENQESNDESNDSDEEHGDILDDILDSSDTEDEEDSDRKGTLSSLFDRKTNTTKQRDDRGRNKPYKPSRARQLDDDEPRSRYGSRSFVDESDEEDLHPRRSGRGISENSFRRSDRGSQNARKQGGFRGNDMYNERQSNGRWKDSRPGGDRRDQRDNGYEERGSRSGGRPSRGRGRSRY